MPASIPDSDLARLLPGSWLVAATNLPYWLSGKHVDPVLSYRLVSERPLRFAGEVRFSTEVGDAKRVVGRDRARGGLFTWRGRGLRRLLRSRWSIAGVNDSGTVLAIHHDKTMSMPAGIDIVVREGTPEPEVRSLVAANAKRFGLSLEDFASLYWFGGSGHASA